MRSSRLNDCAAERSSWLQDAGRQAFRATAHCEKAIPPIGFFPGLARESGHDSNESDGCSDQGSLASIEILGLHRTMESFLPYRCVQLPRRTPRGCFQELLARTRGHQDGTCTQDCDGSWIFAPGRIVRCSTGELVDPVCDPVRNACYRAWR